jgi:hypothetical protein
MLRKLIQQDQETGTQIMLVSTHLEQELFDWIMETYGPDLSGWRDNRNRPLSLWGAGSGVEDSLKKGFTFEEIQIYEKRLNQIIREEQADLGYLIVDMNRIFVETTRILRGRNFLGETERHGKTVGERLTGDGVHPNQLGHRVMALSILYCLGVDVQDLKNAPSDNAWGVTDEMHEALAGVVVEAASPDTANSD